MKPFNIATDVTLECPSCRSYKSLDCPFFAFLLVLRDLDARCAEPSFAVKIAVIAIGTDDLDQSDLGR